MQKIILQWYRRCSRKKYTFGFLKCFERGIETESERDGDMASSKDYLQFILEQLSGLEEITYRAMMGEYILYYRGKIVGGIYDDRLLVKPVKSAVSYMPDARYELPYDGAKEMLLVEEVDDREFLTGLFEAMYEELPAQKVKKKKKDAH